MKKFRDDVAMDRLRELAHYDPEAGLFTWIKGRYGASAGTIAGCVCKTSGYRVICIDYIHYRANRLAWFYMTGEWPGELDVDHKNRIKHDDRWENLRIATRSKNMGNMATRGANTSGIPGVVWDKTRGKWRAQIRLGGRKTNLGRFDCMEQAIAKYNEAARKEFGEFAFIVREANLNASS